MAKMIWLGVCLCGVVLLVGGCRSQPVAWYERPLPLKMAALPVRIDGQVKMMRYGLVGRQSCLTHRRCPVMIVLPGGAQNLNLMQEGLRAWAQPLKDRGWLVLSPVALDRRHLFYRTSPLGLLQWLDQVSQKYIPKGTRPVLVGVSNGGISLFEVLKLRPKMFRVALVAPGYLKGTLPRLPHPTRLVMVVGERDPWRRPMRRTIQTLQALKYPVRSIVVPRTGHQLFGFLTTEKLLQLLSD